MLERRLCGAVAELGVADAELHHLEMNPTLESVKRNKNLLLIPAALQTENSTAEPPVLAQLALQTE